MVGTTLRDIRRYVESLANESGTYSLVCGRTGERPVPASGLRFETRPTARAAAQATEQYRATLRRYDPQLPYYDVIVTQEVANGSAPGRSTAESETDADGRLEAPSDRPEERSPIDFCHTVAGAVFEAIADSPHARIETAIVDTDVAVAETIDHPDDLCLRLLESMAAELAVGLEPAEQADILRSAADRLPAPPVDGDPLDATLSRLRSVSLLEAYAVRPRSIDPDAGVDAWDVTLDEYALGRSAEGVVTLPIALELLRRHPDRQPTISDAERVASRPDSTWRIRVTTASSAPPDGLSCLPEAEGT